MADPALSALRGLALMLRAWLLVPAAALALASCGDHLGSYDVKAVHVVRGNAGGAYPVFLRIEISSEFDLSKAETGAGLYTDGDFCPLQNDDQLIAFGPVATDGTAAEGWERKTPLRRSADGRFHYLVDIVPQSPPRKQFSNSTDTIAGYDIRASGRPICLRFFVPGYNVTPSVSDMIEVPAGTISAAFSAPITQATPAAVTDTP